ncbi:MAG TPA: hypothetical protein VM925_04760 [Labilithrix sp.]|nr:hypothetical protein [Labilithrix sp.]
MNRSSCLSALLVGLSLTTASAALAAPPAAAENPPIKQVAQASQPNAQQGSDTGPSTGDSTAAPAPDGAAPTTPAVTVGTQPAPVADVPAQAPAEPHAKPKPRPFAGSALFIQNSMTTNTVFQGQTQYANPTVESSVWLLPRYAINEAFQLRGRLIVSYEYTNSDASTYRNEPMLSDTTLQLFYRKIPKLPLGIQPAVAINAGLPTSKASRARTLNFTPGATLQLSKGFEHFLGGEAMILSSVTYSHPLYRSRNPVVVDDRPAGSFNCAGGNNCQDLLSGTMNPSDILSYMVLFSPEWGHWNPAIMYLGTSQWVYSPAERNNPVDGTPIGRPEGFEPTSVRQTHYVSAWLDYNFNSWLTGEIGVWNSVVGINGGGSRSSILFDRYQDTRVYLGASFQLDNLVKAIQGGHEGEGGVVRAKNTKTPMWTF